MPRMTLKKVGMRIFKNAHSAHQKVRNLYNCVPVSVSVPPATGETKNDRNMRFSAIHAEFIWLGAFFSDF